MEWVACFVVGAASGIVASLLGAGGGWIVIPGLILGLPLAGIQGDGLIKIAIATTHAVTLLTSIAAARAYAEKNAIHWQLGLVYLPGTCAGNIAGALLATAIDVRLLTGAFVAVALAMAVRVGRHDAETAHLFEPLPSPANLAAKAFMIGCLVGALGAGGLAVPLLHRYMPLRRAIGTVAMISVPTSLLTTLVYALSATHNECPGCIGYISLPAVCATGAGAVLFAPLGAALAHKLPVLALKRIFAVALIFVTLMVGERSMPDALDVRADLKATAALLRLSLDICPTKHAPASTLSLLSSRRASLGEWVLGAPAR